MMKTGLVFHERCMWYETGTAAGFRSSGGLLQPDRHVEEPETKRRIKSLADVSGLTDELTLIKPNPASEQDLLRFHTPDYIKNIQQLSRVGGCIDTGDGSTFVGKTGYDIALLSTGGCIELVDSVMSGRVTNGYALVRPPGHHAQRDQSGGFCVFANGALAVMHAKEKWGLERIAIIDWDAHHGNGTQSAFYDDPSVLTVSVHQESSFPIDSGAINENGSSDGEGYNINIPLPAGSGHGAYMAMMDEVVVPALYAFKPELIVVLSGVDANGADPMSRLMLHSDSYRLMTRTLMKVAADICSDRLVMFHEGGYSRIYAPFCTVAIWEELSGIRCVEDPFIDYFSNQGGQSLQLHQQESINRVSALVHKLKRTA